MSTVKENILKVIDSSNMPLSLQEISEQEGLARSTAIRYLNELVDESKIQKIGTKKRIYYIAIKQTTLADIDNMNKVIGEVTVNTKDIYEDLKDDIHSTQNKLNQIYLNIISLMGIFVAIFALITINTNIIFKAAQSPLCEAIKISVIVNLSAIIVIAILLILMRILIINPLKNQK